jgi:hypothetical protein
MDPHSSAVSSQHWFNYEQVHLPDKATHIRLITFLPISAGDSSTICLELISVPADDSLPSFDSLSYAWGEPEFTEEITINSGLFYITTSLYEALTHIQRSRKSKPIWIDQIW